MRHITLECDYAIRIVDFLSKSNKRLDAKSISESTSVTLRFCLKIMRKLVAHGIVKSFKGTYGGYELARPPVEITLKDVMEAVDGVYMMNRCLSAEYCCEIEVSGDCRYKVAYREISDKVEKMLAEYNFEDSFK